MDRQYVGARYVPKFFDWNGSAEWRTGVAYEALTIVTFNNASYTSKVPVPPTVGNPANNPQYWALTGNYNAQLENVKINYSKCFNTAANMIADTSLTEGMIVKTLGYNKIADNGGAFYKIYNTKEQNSEHYEKLSNGKYALLIPNGYVTPQMFGAVGDGVTDDTSALSKCFNQNNFEIHLKNNATYLVSKPIICAKNIVVYGNNATIKATDGMLKCILYCSSNNTFYNLNITGWLNDKDSDSDFKQKWSARKNEALINVYNCEHITFEKCTIQQNYSEGMKSNNSSFITIRNCIFHKVDCGFISQGDTVSDVIIEHCLFDGHKYSEPISFYCRGEMKNLYVNNNKFINKESAAAMFFGNSYYSTSSVSNATIINNIINNCANGIDLVNCTSITVSGNVFGTDFKGKAITCEGVNGVNIYSNKHTVCYGFFVDISKESSNCAIYDNIIKNVGISNNDSISFAFYIENNLTNCIFKNNIITKYSNTTVTPMAFRIRGGYSYNNLTIIDKNTLDYSLVIRETNDTNFVDSIIQTFTPPSYTLIGSNVSYTNSKISVFNPVTITTGYVEDGMLASIYKNIFNEICFIKFTDPRGKSFSKFPALPNGTKRIITVMPTSSYILLTQDTELATNSIVWKDTSFNKTIKTNEIYTWSMVCYDGKWYEV